MLLGDLGLKCAFDFHKSALITARSKSYACRLGNPEVTGRSTERGMWAAEAPHEQLFYFPHCFDKRLGKAASGRKGLFGSQLITVGKP